MLHLEASSITEEMARNRRGCSCKPVFNVSVAHLLVSLKAQGDPCEWLCNTSSHLAKEREIAYIAMTDVLLDRLFFTS